MEKGQFLLNSSFGGEVYIESLKLIHPKETVRVDVSEWIRRLRKSENLAFDHFEIFNFYGFPATIFWGVFLFLRLIICKSSISRGFPATFRGAQKHTKHPPMSLVVGVGIFIFCSGNLAESS